MSMLSAPEGFTIDVISWDQTILVTIKDHRAHPDFKGDRSRNEWPGIFKKLAAAGLDPAKAVVSLGCDEGSISATSEPASHVIVVRLGWVKSATTTRRRVPAGGRPRIAANLQSRPVP